jgi:hypothetical protein
MEINCNIRSSLTVVNLIHAPNMKLKTFSLVLEKQNLTLGVENNLRKRRNLCLAAVEKNSKLGCFINNSDAAEFLDYG